jgi:hypothetical protein
MDTKKDYGEKHEKHFLCFRTRKTGVNRVVLQLFLFFLSFHSYLQKKEEEKRSLARTSKEIVKSNKSTALLYIYIYIYPNNRELEGAREQANITINMADGVFRKPLS